MLGFHGAVQTQRAAGSGHQSEEFQPARDLRLRDLAKQETLVLALQVVLEQSQGVLMPLQGLGTAVGALLVIEIGLNGLPNSWGRRSMS